MGRRTRARDAACAGDGRHEAAPATAAGGGGATTATGAAQEEAAAQNRMQDLQCDAPSERGSPAGGSSAGRCNFSPPEWQMAESAKKASATPPSADPVIAAGGGAAQAAGIT